MTKEEKIELLNILLEIEEKNDIGNLTSTDRREFQQWAEELEQEPILDKIREEIDDLRNYSYLFTDMIFDEVQRVIDKYKE